jgi:hypothetical protein
MAQTPAKPAVSKTAPAPDAPPTPSKWRAWIKTLVHYFLWMMGLSVGGIIGLTFLQYKVERACEYHFNESEGIKILHDYVFENIHDSFLDDREAQVVNNFEQLQIVYPVTTDIRAEIDGHVFVLAKLIYQTGNSKILGCAYHSLDRQTEWAVHLSFDMRTDNGFMELSDFLNDDPSISKTQSCSDDSNPVLNWMFRTCVSEFQALLVNSHLSR